MKRKNGFTIIEIMVAITVMAIGVVGVYAIVPRIILVDKINTNRFIASQLAREGVEIVRNTRDYDYLGGFGWADNLNGCQSGCEIDYNDSNFSLYRGRKLRIDSNGFYNYETGKETDFKRKIKITPDSNKINIVVEVSWPGKYSPFTLEENLYDWR